MTNFKEDYCAWAEEQGNFLQKKEWDKVDVENVAEEIHSLGDMQELRLEGVICLWMQCMLKMNYYSEKTDKIREWDLLAFSSKMAANDILEENPSLLCKIDGYLKDLYIHAHSMVSLEFDGWLYINDRMPTKCPWTVDKILDTKQGD